jgi:predicted metal-dependent hydrolase
MSISYEIVYTDRKTLNISVERDKSVIVRAPSGLSKERIEEVVQKKKMWILEKINHYQKYPEDIETKEFVSGETMMYLGKNYDLKIVKKEIKGVEFDNGFKISEFNRSRAKEIFKKWLMDQGLDRIKSRTTYYAKNLGVNYKEIKISDMKYRWGSCTVKGNLVFNWRIVKAPITVMDYIIVHELAHLIELNHSPEFWNIVAVQLPEYEKARIWLRNHGEVLERDF